MTQDCGAADSEDDGLSLAEDLAASGTLDDHEVRVLVLHNLLQLVLAPLIRGSRIQEDLSKRHDGGCSRMKLPHATEQ